MTEQNKKAEFAPKKDRKEALANFAKESTQKVVGPTRSGYLWSERDQGKTFLDMVNSDIASQVMLSEDYYNASGYYAQLIRHYSTLLLYKGIMTPHPKNGKFSKTQVNGYNRALKALEELNIPTIGKRIAFEVLLRGTYYGLIHKVDDGLFLIDLPRDYCRVVARDQYGNLIISFDVSYFDGKKELLDAYPVEIQQHYFRWKRSKANHSSVIALPTDLAVAFRLFGPQPYFLSSIDTIDKYEESLKRAKEKEEKDIEQIIAQEIPHYQDQLLFEPDEAEEMHKGLLAMTQGTEKTSVITTYGEIKMLSTPIRDAATRGNLDQMRANIYSGAGVSNELFSATTSAALKTSLQKDLSIMMTFANDLSMFLQGVINSHYGTSTLSFSYEILPISLYNQEEYMKMTLQAANSGFSYLLPAIASGVSQGDLVDLKGLENELGLRDLLTPLASAHTQSAKDSAGRPKLRDEEKSDKTVENEEAGGSTNEERAD